MRKKLTSEESLKILEETIEPIKQLSNKNQLANFLYKHAFFIALNANDTFGWACADAVEVSIEDLPKLLEVYNLYNVDGVNAFMALVEGNDVLGPLQTKEYKQAKEFLKDYRPASWVL